MNVVYIGKTTLAIVVGLLTWFTPGASAQRRALSDETGFAPIFDGKGLTGWDGDPRLWRVDNGVIVGQTTPATMPKQNSFLIWRGGSPTDFELRLEYRLTGGNSGIQYRSVEVPGIPWAMEGYQADIDSAQQYTGQIYEERGRGFLALRGQFTDTQMSKPPELLASLGDQEVLKKWIRSGNWNSYDIIARGNVLIQILNGHVMSMLIDEDPAHRRKTGLIGIQLHVGEPMKVEVRNARLKRE
jgi:3-keto-disaccharide hydrolase